jgi:hypothetical protein
VANLIPLAFLAPDIVSSILCCEGRVSAVADSMAAGGVWSELVSRGGSLLSRENTGNFFDSGLV